MEADHAPPFEVTSSARRRKRVCIAAVRESFLHSIRLKGLLQPVITKEVFLQAWSLLPAEASPLPKTTAWEPLPQATDETLLIVLDYLLVDGDNGTQKEGKLSHPQQRQHQEEQTPASISDIAPGVLSNDGHSDPEDLGARNLKTPPDAPILFLGWETLDDLQCSGAVVVPPSETFVSENHQDSQMQDESAQLASISEKWQDEAALAWAYCIQDCSSDHKQNISLSSSETDLSAGPFRDETAFAPSRRLKLDSLQASNQVWPQMLQPTPPLTPLLQQQLQQPQQLH